MAPQHSDSNEILVLKGLEAVRLRPGFYLGGSDKKALHHCFAEVEDNCIDEALAKDPATKQPYCTQIVVVIESDGETISVEDNGRGIPVSVHTEYEAEGTTQLELALTKLHAGGKFTHEVASGGLHGVGVSCVNAVSDSTIVRVWRDGGEWEQKFSKGIPLTKTLRLGDSRKRGTKVTFHADIEIFQDGVAWDEDWIVARLREAAMLNGGLSIKFTSKKTGRTENFLFPGGVSDYVAYLAKSRMGIYPALPILASGSVRHEGTKKTIEVQAALQWADDDAEMVKAFANNITNPDGGTHLSGFKTALTQIINQFARSSGLLKEKSPNLTGDDIREGLTAVISVRVPQPQFESQTKVKLVSAEVEGVVNSIVGEALTEFFEKNPSIVAQIVKRATLSQEARSAAKKAQELVKRKSLLGKHVTLPGKLFDCNSEDRTRAELFLVEGDSAAGPAINGRNAEYQAVLALRGKIINAEKSDMMSLLKNEEVQAIIASVGTGILDDFDINKLRYNKVLISVDADVDGAHIATLIIAFFYRLMPQLILGGHIYLAKPPLFKIEHGKDKFYAFDIKGRDAITSKLKGRVNVTRFKGLGEMNFDELRDTTMDIEKRKLQQLTISDVAEAERILSVLMGNNVVARKEHIVAKSQIRAVK